MVDAPLFSGFRKWIAGKTFIFVLIAAALGGLWYVTHTIGAVRLQNETLAAQVETLTRARAADRAAQDARQTGRDEAAADYAIADQTLSDGATAAPTWASEKLPAGIVEGLR